MRILSILSDSPLIEALSCISPPTGIVEIGAALPIKASVPNWASNVPVHLVDSLPGWAEEARLPEHVTRSRAILSSGHQKLTYHISSLPPESGLLSPDQLTPFWQNITLERTVETTAQSLDEVLSDRPEPLNWLFIDDLNGKAILEGGSQTVRQAHVIVIRCLLNNQDPAISPASSREDLTAFATQLGFRVVRVLAGRHPALGYLVLIRDSLMVQPKSGTETDDEDEDESEISKIKAEREQWEQRARLAQNNLKDLQAKHKALSNDYLEQAKLLESVQALLQSALSIAEASEREDGKEKS